MNSHSKIPDGIWLEGLSKFVVVLTFVLIFVGGHTTTAGAGMAFPDWPLSHGSLYPNRWWDDFLQRLEHGHRLIASVEGVAVAVLCAGVWGRLWAVGASIVIGAVIGVAAKVGGLPGAVVHGALWGTVVSFVVFLVSRSGAASRGTGGSVRLLALLAFFGVCFQAVLGGLRVTIESGGRPEVALIFRVVHGCFAQVELALLVAVAAMLSRFSRDASPCPLLLPMRRWLYVILCALFIQLLFGATMRHRGAGLAIPSFPATDFFGGWVPSVHTVDVYLNYLHTRLGALAVTVLIVLVLGRLMYIAGGQVRIRLWAGAGLALVLVQICLGISIIWHARPMIPTTLHVLNGAGLVAVIVLLGVRVSACCGCVADCDRITSERKADGFAG